MARITTPRYFRSVKLASGETAHYWTLPTWARAKRLLGGELVKVERHGVGCPFESQALGNDLPAAWQKAENINQAFDKWRVGQDQSKGMLKGTVSWLFAWYRATDKFKKLKAKTRESYRANMNAMEQYPMKNGGTLGDRMASSVESPLADKIYIRLQESRGPRQATYFMQVCRLVWNHAARPGYDKVTGVTKNPFAKMGLSSAVAKGNRYTTRDEYNRYRETARAMGFQSMATAAALGFECVNRVWDVFGFTNDAANPTVGALWIGYRAGNSLTMTQSKTGAIKTIPLFDKGSDGGIIALYPALEEELARTPRVHALIVVEERNGKPYTLRRMSSVHRQICEAAGLPKDMTFTGFRHGGATEIGESGEVDPRAITGHKQIETTAVYAKQTQAKARQIGRRRRDHIDNVS